MDIANEHNPLGFPYKSNRMMYLKLILPLIISFALSGCNSSSNSADTNNSDNDNIDPSNESVSFPQQAFLKASNAGSFDYFGRSLSFDGNTLVVGAPGEAGDATSTASSPNNAAGESAGAAYVYTQIGEEWSQQAYLKASNADYYDHFGYSVDIDGNTLVVGAPYASDDSTIGEGAVYIFTRTGDVWGEQAYVKPNDAGSIDRFGLSVALDGDTLAVGRPTVWGAVVYVFTRSGDVWSERKKIDLETSSGINIINTFLNISVDLDSDTLVIGALYEQGDANSSIDNINSNAPSAGAVFVFTGSGEDWTQQAYLKASNAEQEDQFGASVAIEGDTLAVGAYRESGDANSTMPDPNNNADESGAVYVFSRNGEAWSQQAYLKANNAEQEDWFGFDVDLADDTLIVGAYKEGGDEYSTAAYPNNNQGGAGAAYVFKRSGGEWNQIAYLKAINAWFFDGFGESVALDQDTFIVGASAENSSANYVPVPHDKIPLGGASAVVYQSGAAYVFP